MNCEVCGSQIRAGPSLIEIDGAVLHVCQGCAKRGRPVSVAPQASRVVVSRRTVGTSIGPALEIDPDYATMVRLAREKMGLTQEALGRRINVKPSVISHVETGKIKPDIALARTLSHHLKLRLLVPSSELD